jgi:hypothetical protein
MLSLDSSLGSPRMYIQRLSTRGVGLSDLSQSQEVSLTEDNTLTALHKGTLASLSGIESGDYPVDVIFCMPGDAMLRR